MTPRAEGPRVHFADLPVAVRAWVRSELGSTVIHSSTQFGGFSPGAASRLATADGGRAFLKAVGAEINERSTELHRWEIRAMRCLPRIAQAPRLLATFDQGGWVALLLEDIEGRAPDLAHAAERELVFDAVDELTRSLTPTPWTDAPRAEVKAHDFLTRWTHVRAAPPSELDPWLTDRLDWLVDQSQLAVRAIAGNTLTHWDIRADNILLTTDHRVVFVDWAHACLAQPWVNYLELVTDVLQYADPEPLLDRYAAVRDADPAQISAFVAAVCGGLTWGGYQPDPPGLPTIRIWQRHQAGLWARWLRRRVDQVATR